jgi:hypothetical protein
METPKRTRGKICILCDRKFILCRELSTSLKQIDAQNMTLTALQQIMDKHMLKMSRRQQEFEEELDQHRYQLAEIDPQIDHAEAQLAIFQERVDAELEEQIHLEDRI